MTQLLVIVSRFGNIYIVFVIKGIDHSRVYNIEDIHIKARRMTQKFVVGHEGLNRRGSEASELNDMVKIISLGDRKSVV